MIKAIALDLDGTLLGENLRVSKRTAAAIDRAQEQGIHLLIATGRSYLNARELLGSLANQFDYIASSGAEVFTKSGDAVSVTCINPQDTSEVCRRLEGYPVSLRICSDMHDYVIGDEQARQECIEQEIKYFFANMDVEDRDREQLLDLRMERLQCVESPEVLHQAGVPVLKLFLFCPEIRYISELEQVFSDMPQIACASSFRDNIELTHIRAQKGFALRDFTNMLGMKMEEVMAVGDSMNDYSMLSMEFGATVAMGNAAPEIKAVSKFMTLPNTKDGVAYAIDAVLDQRLERLGKPEQESEIIPDRNK